MAWRIRDWDRLFENNRTRELQTLTWVPVPNRMDGDGYTELVDHPHGAAHLGAWLAMVEIASRCGPRGTLVRSGGQAHDEASLARLSRLPADVFREVIPRLLRIGWIEIVDPSLFDDAAGVNGVCSDRAGEGSQLPAIIPQAGADKRLRNGMEWNGMEKKKDNPPTEGSAEAAAPPSPEAAIIPQAGAGESGEESDGEEAVLVFDCVGGRTSKANAWALTAGFAAELSATFPGVDVPAECRAAWTWTRAKPANRKTADGMKDFLFRWMKREQNRGGGRRAGAGDPGGSRLSRSDERAKELAERL